MNAILAIAGAILRAVNAARRWLYRTAVLRPARLPRPVISIGNIAAGGAGKTPAVIAVARYLTDRGLKVAVLSRGYGRKETQGGLVTALDPDRFGDEPVLIKKKTSNVDVIVGSDRIDNARAYLEINNCDCFVLDDGFQHLQLHRDLDIVIDVGQATLFRESRSALRDADIVIPRNLLVTIPPALKGKRVFAFAALADNAQFFNALVNAGVIAAGDGLGFRDHHRYSDADLAGIDAAAKGFDAIVTTEKDAVKIARRDIIPIPAEFVIEPEVLEQIYRVARG